MPHERSATEKRGRNSRGGGLKGRSSPPAKARTGQSGLDLLIIECDAAKLEADGLAVADATAFGLHLTGWASRRPLRIETVKAGDLAYLVAQLGKVKETFGTARAVLLIGHSNATGIRLASDRGVTWAVAARFIEPFRPSHVALLACLAGGREAASALASELPTVREIAASPATATTPAVVYLAGWLLMKACRTAIPTDLKITAQAALAFLGRNVVFHWTRRELKETTFENLLGGQLLAAGARVLVDVLRQGAAPRR